MEKRMEPLSDNYSDEDLLALIHWHMVDIVVGFIGTVLCILTLVVFLSSKKFFQSNKLLTLLAVGDLLTCLGVLTVGLIRKNMYTAALETGRVPVEMTRPKQHENLLSKYRAESILQDVIMYSVTIFQYQTSTWSCAVKPFVILRLLGSLIPPGIVFWISIERFLAVFSPITYRNRITKHTGIPPLVIIIYVIIATIIAYAIAWMNRIDSPAPFYCGRKVSFTAYYSSYVYCADITGFMMALILNILTLCKLANLYARRKNRFEVKRQLKRIRYMIVISLVSTLFVAVPNAISLVSAWIGRIDMYFSEPAVWMIAFKSSINVFVYLLLKTEFRQRVYEMLGCLNIEEQKRERAFDVSVLPSNLIKENLAINALAQTISRHENEK